MDEDTVKIHTYAEHEAIPDSWLSLHRRLVGPGRPTRWVLTFKLPWKARIYTISNDAWALMNPRVSFGVSWERRGLWLSFTLMFRRDPFWHQCTREELARQIHGDRP